MTSHEKTTNLASNRWLQRLARFAMFTLIFGSLLTDHVHGTEDAADPYDALYDVIMTRHGKDGKSYAENESSPAIFDLSDFPFGDKTYKKFSAALDAFEALPQTRIEAYSDIKRALLQRHLWKVFDATLPGRQQRLAALFPNRQFPAVRSHSDRRAAVRPKIASLIERLALTRAQILAIPNTMAATVKSGGFAQRHDPEDRFKPFLPADLYSKESSWICLGDGQRGGARATDPEAPSELDIPADIHSTKFKWRSAFLPFMRVPGGRIETLKCVEKFNRKEVLPVGTQFALIEQAFLISDDGELILSPLIVSISLRAYVGVNPSKRTGRPQATQSVAEFLMQPRRLMQGDAVMKALDPQDYRYEAGTAQDLIGGTFDLFETREGTGKRLNNCIRCHGQSFPNATRTIGFRTARPLFLKEDSPESISKATSTKKRNDDTWKTLLELWQADSAKRGTQAPARPDQPQPPLDNKGSTTGGAEGAADPYDALYDVIMTRHGKDGKSYAENESSPALFSESEFPFGDKTYKKFSAALDAFEALPQTKIEAYSDVKRALLQRHLWKLFDVTSPYRWIDPQTGDPRVANRNHSDRRAAVQPQIASLIQRLALTRAQIQALPDTRAATVKSGGFALRHDATDQFKPFLPADLYAKESSWVCIGTDETIPVDLHVERVKWRSAFYSFIRLPKGRPETLENLKNAHSKEQFPVGTQVALIEQALLISDKGELILSPLITSISVRAYLNVNLSARKAHPDATQCVAEFVMQPRELMKGNAVMKAMDPLEHRFEASEKFICQDTSDPFETGRIPRRTRLNSCMSCHSGAGHRSVLTSGGAGPAPLFASSPAAISKATTNEKRKHHTWKALHELWRANAKKEDAQPPARSEPPQSLPGNNESTTCGAEETEATDPYDVLYDAIMTRYGPDGKAYGAHESSPSIFRHSTFPFGDKTYKKLDAALDAFAGLPQKKIEAYSDIKRALMQRHLWHVFDATVPLRWTDFGTRKVHEYRGTHPDRRDAVRSKIASLIQRLALTKAQILALPETRAVTVESGGFSRRHDTKDPFKPFLPAELYSTESSWVSIGFDDEPPAPFHSKKLKFRSAFLTFMRLPGGRRETLEYMKNGTQDRGNVQHFPAGTQFAFMEQAFLISDEGEMVLSPLIVSISLRAYLNVERNFWRTRPPTQSLVEFVSPPRQLMQGNAVMKALGQTDLRLDAGDVDGFGVAAEPFEKSDGRPRNNMLRIPRLTLCMRCHSERGVEGVGGGAGLFGVKEKSPEEIVKATLTYKREHHTWKTLSELWRADSAEVGAQSPARPVQLKSGRVGCAHLSFIHNFPRFRRGLA